MADTELPYTDELLERANGAIADVLAEPYARPLAAALLRRGVGLIDTARRAFLVDLTVHEGVLHRLAHWRDLAERIVPVPMVLFCPRCGDRHIDQPDPENGWLNPPHRSHLCAGCGLIWRPADICTVGVADIATRGRLDIPPDEIRQEAA